MDRRGAGGRGGNRRLVSFAAAFYSIGIPKDSVLKYETALKTEQFLLITHGSPAEVTKAQQILRTTPVADLGVHLGEPVPVDGKGVTRSRRRVGFRGAAAEPRDRPASGGHVGGDGATPGVPPGSWRRGATNGADGGAVPQLGPRVSGGRGSRIQGRRRGAGGHARLTMGWGQEHATNEKASETARTLAAGVLWPPCRSHSRVGHVPGPSHGVRHMSVYRRKNQTGGIHNEKVSPHRACGSCQSRSWDEWLRAREQRVGERRYGVANPQKVRG